MKTCRKAFIFGLLLLQFGVAQAARTPAPHETVRVGIFPLDPLNYMDEAGTARGLNPDLLREIVQKNLKGNLEFVPVSWAEGLEKLQSEELDLMVSVALTDKRAQTMDYNHSSVAEVWGQVFAPTTRMICSISDLKGKRVGIMRKDISGSNFVTLTKEFSVDCEMVPYASQESGSETGLGDITLMNWFSPPPKGPFMWGVGPVTVWPTATDDILGADKFSIGPSAVLVYQNPKFIAASVVPPGEVTLRRSSASSVSSELARLAAPRAVCTASFREMSLLKPNSSAPAASISMTR